MRTSATHMQRNAGPGAHHVLIALTVAFAILTLAAPAAGANPTPVAAYSFDEASGAKVTDSAGDHDGTISGAIWTPAGKYGSALTFDGVNDVVSIADTTDLDLTSSFTLEAWVYLTKNGTAGPVLSKAESAGGSSGYFMSAKFNGKPAGFASSSGTTASVVAPTALPAEAWRHLAFTSDGSKLRLYVDGTPVEPKTAITAKATAANLEIGHSQTLGGYFDGLIDELRIYNQALSQSQIEADRNTPVTAGYIPVGQQKVPFNEFRRIGVDENGNLDFIGDSQVEGRVDVDVAMIDTGVDRHADLEVPTRTDCAQPHLNDPLFSPPNYGDSSWLPNLALNELEANDPLLHPDAGTTYQYGCLNGAGYDGLDDGKGHGTDVGEIVAEADNGRGSVGLAPGARLWSVEMNGAGVRNGFTALCKAGVSSKAGGCLGKDQYPAQTALQASSAQAVISIKSGGSTIQVSCASTLEAKTSTEYGIPLPLTVSSWALSGCKNNGANCTVSSVNAPYNASLTYTGPSSDDGLRHSDGTLKIAAGAGGKPGWKVVCAGSNPPLDCTYSFEPELEMLGGSSASLIGSKESLNGAGEKCPGEAPVFEATYGISSPQPLYVAISSHRGRLYASHVVAALDWVTDRRREYNDGAADGDAGAPIAVATMAVGCKVPWQGPGEDPNPSYAACERGDLIYDAIDRLVAQGVVPVAASGNLSMDIRDSIAPASHPDVIAVSAVGDADGEPGGLGTQKTCLGYSLPTDQDGVTTFDDRRAYWSDWGTAVDIANPNPIHENGCVVGGTSAATGVVSGATALLASQCLPHSRSGVQAIANTLSAEGSYGWDDIGTVRDAEGRATGWSSGSPDGWKEPLLDVSDAAVFDPKLVGESPQGECGWLEKETSFDVDGDRRSDLVRLASGGDANVHRGMMVGSDYGPGGFDMSVGKTSPALIDPALLDGVGQYVVDVTDVTGDGRSDLVTWAGTGGTQVHRGKADRSFEAASGYASSTSNDPGMNGAGSWEPVGVAKVNADAYPDLVAVTDDTNVVTSFLGTAAGDFFGGNKFSTPEGLNTALYDGVGDYFLDATDVNGDGRADLVSMNTNGSAYVFKGKEVGTFEAGVTSAVINPVMDDGKGEEPIGLGDANGDGRADLLTLSDSDSKLRLRLGKEDGSFATATTPYASTINSSLLDGTGQELVGLLDYGRDGLADLVALNEEGDLLTYKAQVSGGVVSFAGAVVSAGSIESIAQGETGQELASQKPLLRRAGCASSGCALP